METAEGSRMPPAWQELPGKGAEIPVAGWKRPDAAVAHAPASNQA